MGSSSFGPEILGLRMNIRNDVWLQLCISGCFICFLSIFLHVFFFKSLCRRRCRCCCHVLRVVFLALVLSFKGNRVFPYSIQGAERPEEAFVFRHVYSGVVVLLCMYMCVRRYERTYIVETEYWFFVPMTNSWTKTKSVDPFLLTKLRVSR